MLLRQPTFTLVAVLTLAMGLGVNTTVFTFLNAALRPLPVPDPQQLVAPLVSRRSTPIFIPGHSASGVIESDYNRITADYFQTLRQPLVRGRIYTEQEVRE